MKDCGSCCCDNQKSSDTMMEDSLAAASQNSPLTAKEDDDDSNPDLAMDFIQRVWLNYNQTFNNNHNMERSFSSLRCLTFSSTRNSDEDGDDDEEAPAQAPTTTSRATPTTQATTTTAATTTPCLTSQHLDYLRQEMAALSPHVRPNAVEITPNVVSFAAHSGAALRALLGSLTGEPMLILQGQVPVQPSGGGGGGGTTTTMGRPTTTLDEFDSLLTCLKLSSPLLQPSNRTKNSHCRQDGNSDDDDDDGSTTSLAACRSSMSCSSCCDPPVAPAGVTLALLQLNLAGAMAGRQVGELVAQYWSKPCGLYMNGCQFNASFAQALAITSAIRVPYVLIVNHPQHCENNDQDNNNEDDDDDEEEKETAAQEQHEQQDRDQNTGITRRSALDPLWQFWAQESPSTREGKHHSSRGPSMIQLCHMDVHAHTLTCLTKLVLKIPSLTNSVNSRMTTTTMMKCSALQILKLKNISFDTSIPNHQWQAFVHAILHRVPSVDLSGCRNLPLVQVLAQSTICAATASSRMVTTKNPKKLSVSQSTSTIVLGCQELILANTNLFQDCNGTQDLDRLHNFFQALFLSRDGDHIKEQHLFHSLLELDLSNCGVNNTVALALFSALEQQQHRSSTSNHPKLQKLVLGTTTVGNGEQHDDSIRASTQSRLYNQMLDHKTKHWMDCLPQISCLQELHLPSSLFFSTSSTSPPSVLAAGRKRFLESLARNSSLTKVVLVSRKLEHEEDETYLMGTTNNNEDEDDLHFSHQIRAITNRNIGIRSVQEALLLAAQEDDNNNSIATTGRPDHWIDVSWSVGGDKNNNINNNNITSPETISNPNHSGASSSSSSSSSGDYYWSNRNLGLLTSCTVLEPTLRNHNHSALYLLLQQGIFPHMVAATLRHSRPLMKAYNKDDPTTTGLNCHSSSNSTCDHF